MSNCNCMGMKLAGAQEESFWLVNHHVVLVIFQITDNSSMSIFSTVHVHLWIVQRNGTCLSKTPKRHPQLLDWHFMTALITITVWSTNERAPRETLSISETLKLIKTIPTLKGIKMLWKYIKSNCIWREITEITCQYVKYSSSPPICTIRKSFIHWQDTSQLWRHKRW